MQVPSTFLHGRGDVINKVIEKYCRVNRAKSRAMSAGELNLVIEFDSKQEKECTDALLEIEGAHSVATLTHDGEVTY